jgi:hypothetical protein
MSLTVENLREIWSNEFLPSIQNEIRDRISEVNKKIDAMKSELRKEIEPLKTNLKSLNRKVEEEGKSREFMSKKYDSILTTISEVKKTSLGLERQAKEMEGKVDKLSDNGYNLELRLDELEQYGRRDCLEITGIPAAVNENPTKLVKELSEVIGENLAESDISIAHRLPSTRKAKDRLIVKFNRRVKKQEIYASRKKLKSKRAKVLSLIAGNPIFQSVMSNTRIHINESLTPYRKRLFGRILEFKQESKFKYLWTVNGKIMLRETDDSPTLSFVSHEQFDDFL